MCQIARIFDRIAHVYCVGRENSGSVKAQINVGRESYNGKK